MAQKKGDIHCSVGYRPFGNTKTSTCDIWCGAVITPVVITIIYKIFYFCIFKETSQCFNFRIEIDRIFGAIFFILTLFHFRITDMCVCVCDMDRYMRLKKTRSKYVVGKMHVMNSNIIMFVPNFHFCSWSFHFILNGWNDANRVNKSK